MDNSVKFSWDIDEFAALLDCCNRDDGVQLLDNSINAEDYVYVSTQ